MTKGGEKMKPNPSLSTEEVLKKLTEIDELLSEIVFEDLEENKDGDILTSQQELLETKTKEVLKAELTERQFEKLVEIYKKIKPYVEGISIDNGAPNKVEKEKLKASIIERAKELQTQQETIDAETFDRQEFLKRKESLRKEKATDADKKIGVLEEVKKVRKVAKRKIRKFFNKRKKAKEIEDKYQIENGETPLEAMQRRKKELKKELYGEGGNKKTPGEGSLYQKLAIAKVHYDKIWRDNAEVVYRIKHPIIGSMRRPEKRISNIDLAGKTEEELKEMSRELRWKLRQSEYAQINEKIASNENELTDVEKDIKAYKKYLPGIEDARHELLKQINSGEWSDDTKGYLNKCDDNELATVLGGKVEESELRKTARDSQADTIRLTAEMGALQGGNVARTTNSLQRSGSVRTTSSQTPTMQGKTTKTQNKGKEDSATNDVDPEKEKLWKLMTKKERKVEVEKFLLGNKKNWFAKMIVKMGVFFAGGAEKFHDEYVKKTKVTTKASERQWSKLESEFKNSIARTVATKSGNEIGVTGKERITAYTSAANKDIEIEQSK